MPLKTNKAPPKHSCDKSRRNISTEKTFVTKPPRKLLISKKWHQNCSHDVKTKSVGIIESKEQRPEANKTSISLSTVRKDGRILDFCKTCGDVCDTASTVVTNKTISRTKEEELINQDSNQVMETELVKEYYKNEKFANSNSTMNYMKSQRNFKKSVKINTKNKNTLETSKQDEKEEVVQEHYLNEKFADLYNSTHEIDTIIRNDQALDPIVEVNEKQASSESKTQSTAVSDGKSSLESNYCIIETSDDNASLRRLKEFRENNYFECHSARNRVKTKGSVITLRDHKCSYRLYLNDRLFPVAMDDDHNGVIRCVDCHLPLELASEEDKANGTIQAKVKMGSETKDLFLLLPIKEPLIIKQKRKERNDSNVVYFGLIRLDQNGDSIFNRSLPSDSLALRYQKGYRQFGEEETYRYDKVDESDVIVI